MKYIATILCSAFLLVSCGSDDSNDTAPGKEVEMSGESKITYEGNIKAIIDAKCTQCHALMPVRRAPFGLTDFADVTLRDREERIAARATLGTMPPMSSGEVPLTAEEVALINQWIKDGALEK